MDKARNRLIANLATNRLIANFVTSSVANISKRNITRSEKEFSLVPTPEKIEKWHVQINLEKLGPDIHLIIHSSSIKIPENLTPIKIHG